VGWENDACTVWVPPILQRCAPTNAAQPSCGIPVPATTIGSHLIQHRAMA